MQFEGKVALVTGGAGGIGAATVQRLSEGGAKVIVTDLDGSGHGAGMHGTRFFPLDVSCEEAWPELMNQVLGEFGQIDILVNAAGIEGNVLDSSPLCSFAEWKRVLSVNLDGTFLAIRAVLPSMLERKSGSIINLSSLAHYVGLPATVPYAVSKSGVWNLSRAVAAYAAAQGTKVRCNSVHPGMIETRMLTDIGAAMRKMRGDAAPSGALEVSPVVPFGTFGQPGEVADLIAYLASDQAAYITGSEFRIDGGWGLWSNRH